MEPQLRPPCSPDLTNFKHSSPCHKEQQRSWPSKRTTNNRSAQMPTAVVVDSQMANCNRFGYQQAIPHSPFIASTSEVLDLQAGKKSLSSGLVKPSQASTTLSRQIHQWLGSRKTSHPYTKGILDKDCALRSTLQGLLKCMKVLCRVYQEVFLTFRTFLSKYEKYQTYSCRANYTKLTFQTFLSKYESTRLNRVKYGLTFLRPSSHVVGKWVCLVMLWQKPARRDKQWNYIPLEFQRYTKLNLDTGYLYGHVENVWGIPFPKRME